MASVSWVDEGVLLLGQISAGSSSLVLLELTVSEKEDEPTTGSSRHAVFKVLATRSLTAEPTTIHCWKVDETTTASLPTLQYCCVGSLEPSILVFQITNNQIQDIYTESLGKKAMCMTSFCLHIQVDNRPCE